MERMALPKAQRRRYHHHPSSVAHFDCARRQLRTELTDLPPDWITAVVPKCSVSSSIAGAGPPPCAGPQDPDKPDAFGGDFMFVNLFRPPAGHR
jgi:hypothetical protein